MFGYPCELDELRAICERHGLALIEDCGRGARRRVQGRADRLARAVRRLRLLPEQAARDGRGRRRLHARRATSGSSSAACATRAATTRAARWFHHVRLGWNYRWTDVQAAIGIGAAREARPDAGAAGRGGRALRASCSRASTASSRCCADDADHRRSWFVYVVAAAAGRRPRARDGGAARAGHRHGRVRAVRPPAAVHARGVRLLGGRVPGGRGLRARARWRCRSSRSSRPRTRSGWSRRCAAPSSPVDASAQTRRSPDTHLRAAAG